MPSLVVPNAALLRLIWSFSGVPYAINVIGCQNSSGSAATQAACNSLGTAIKGYLTSSGLGAFLADAVALQTVGLRNISVANQVEYLDVAAPVSGTGGADMLPPQISLVVTLRTALAGRSFRGRTFLPGFCEPANSGGGTAVAGAGTAAALFLDGVAAALAAQSLPMAIISRPRPDATPPSVGFVTPVTAAVVRDLVWDTQRRRAVPGI